MLSIYNTLTKSKEVFKPLDGNKVRMYVCGMTVYDYCHLGHGRSMVAFDLVTRWLRFSGYDLTYVRNITDIDDKIINRARENGEAFDALTARMIDAMHEDEARLNILKPDMEPRATDYIGGMHDMIQSLIDKGYVRREKDGRAFRFLPAVSRDELVGARLDDIADRVCDGQSMPLLLNLVHKANFSSADLDRFRAMLDELDGPATGEGEPC